MTFIEMLGPTAIPTIICLVIGLVMLVIELFTPGIGVAGATGLVALIAVVVMQLGWGNPRVALYIIAISLLIIILALIWIIRSLQRGRLSKSFLVLNEQVDGTSVPDVASAKSDLVGKSGIALTPLRPAGIAEIEGKRVDVMTAGEFLAKGCRVTVAKAEGMHILVSEAEAE
ncbi:MAG: NfeD family protein [Eubacteriales bacterium]|nr:NfeD family protein [Eubacteriales bacterium]